MLNDEEWSQWSDSEIARKCAVDHKTVAKYRTKSDLGNFENIEAVKDWMDANQLGRRNLTDGWKFELAQARKEILLEKGRENMSAGGGDKKTGLSTADKPDIEPINTQKEIAKDLSLYSQTVLFS